MTVIKNIQRHNTSIETRDNGVIILTCKHACDPVVDSTGDWLHRWAKETPNAVFLAERSGETWRELSYAQSLDAVLNIAAALLDQGLGYGDRLAILSGNSVDHGLLLLAAQYIGVITVPVTEQYSLIPEANDRLIHIIEKTGPRLIYVSDSEQFAHALSLDTLKDIPVVASKGPDALPFLAFLKGAAGQDVNAAHKKVSPETIAKILFTSGSTSLPKGVETTQRMMCVNQAQMGAVMPFLKDKPPKIVDWLPWNHVFGGSHNFNMMLAHGGSLYVDNGKPAPGLFETSIENLRQHSGNIAFNVPVGWALLVDALKTDADLRKRFFDGLELIFYAGASLQSKVWDDLQELAQNELGHIPMMVSSWGMTETSPGTLSTHEPLNRNGLIGVPLPLVEVKLIPESDQRFELRVRGPNIMNAYYNDPAKTQAAFDEEGFLITDDAVRFADPDDINIGLFFDGRLSEDFKLMSGTWVQTTALRAIALATLGPLAQDVVVVGQGQKEVGLLIFPNQNALLAEGLDWQGSDGALIGGSHALKIKACLTEIAAQATGSSSRISRALVLSDPPSLRNHEITTKGNLNVQKVLARRAHLVDRLYDDSDAAALVV